MAGYIQTAKNDNWGTPDRVLGAVLEVFGGSIDMDPCGNELRLLPGVKETILLPHPKLAQPDRVGCTYADGLAIDWTGYVYCNPPYGEPLDAWLTKCVYEKYAHTIALIPAVTSRRVWQDTVPAAKAVCFVDGRLKFHGAKNSAGFSSALVLWTEDRYLPDRFAQVMCHRQMGMVVRP